MSSDAPARRTAAGVQQPLAHGLLEASGAGLELFGALPLRAGLGER